VEQTTKIKSVDTSVHFYGGTNFVHPVSTMLRRKHDKHGKKTKTRISEKLRNETTLESEEHSVDSAESERYDIVVEL
jgi:hypothetical protein